MRSVEKFEVLVSALRTELNGISSEELTPQVIRDLVRSRGEMLAPICVGLNEEHREEIARYFEQQFEVVQLVGPAIKSNHFRPWLQNNKAAIDFYYWDRCREYLLKEEKYPKSVVLTIDQDTDEILDFAGNPKEGGFQRRGMVIGQVQSGKTSSYSSLICKAADSGYKVIILLTGITNSLRSQTQERIDHAFLGHRSDDGPSIESQRIGAGKFCTADKTRDPVSGTTLSADFSVSIARFRLSIENLKEPIIFTTKKNPSTLKNIHDWLKRFNPSSLIEHPLLLIDDEADNASINTKQRQNDITKINEGIRKILGLFKTASYVGYTATPFANIFIKPDSYINDEIADDLFPGDYIKVIDPPSNYVGASRVFEKDGDLFDLMVRNVTDFEDILPIDHKNNRPISGLPPSLKQAVLCFLLIKTIRYISDKPNAHCTMMVNVSRFNSVQQEVGEQIWEYLDTVDKSIRYFAKNSNKREQSALMCELEDLFHSEFSENTDLTWAEVKDQLQNSTATIVVKIVNMKKGALEYEKHKKEGLHVIAVGGLALSRGLTLEGLCVSYILRNPSAYDTLMQMGRWFGYRPGYEGLCRIFIPDFASDYYQFISESTSELTNEIEYMRIQGKTPREFGLKVRKHPEAIRITAANKMSSASEVSVSLNYSGKHKEAFAISLAKTTQQKNLDCVTAFLGSLERIDTDQLFWSNIPNQKIIELLTDFSFPAICKDFHSNKNGTSLIVDYIDALSHELQTWDVCLPQPARTKYEVDGLLKYRSVRARERHKGVIQTNLSSSNKVLKITAKNKVADPEDLKHGLQYEAIKHLKPFTDKKLIEFRRGKNLNPLICIHVFDTREAISPENSLGINVSLSVLFPETAGGAPERTYMSNDIYNRLNALSLDDSDDSDEDLDSLYV